ncbi:MAG: amidohydrolase family protein [Acidimicrobiia bacterium]
MVDLVIRNAMVADGVSPELRRADVAVDKGVIVAVGRVDDSSTNTIDADGLVLSPGLIDVHTHYDAQLFWDGAATPSSLHGVTTVMAGNCGFSIAPLEPSQADYLAAMLARVEGIPLESLMAGVPWNWRTFGEYLAQLDGQVAVNAGFMVGHTTIRRAVMGADDEREATAAEVTAMEGLLRESLAAGGFGLSSSIATSHNDANGRAISARYASRDEILRLCKVTGEYPGTTLEFIPSVSLFFEEHHMDLMTSMSLAADRPLNWNILNVNTTLWDGSQQRLTAGDYARERGATVIALTMPISSTMYVNFVSGFVIDTFDGWTDLFEMPGDARLSQLREPERRARMRKGVEQADTILTRRMRDWSALIIGDAYTPATKKYEGRSLGQIVADEGGDAFEKLIDIVIADDLRTVIVIPPIGNDPDSWRLRAQVWNDERALIGGSDSGAHLDMINTFIMGTSLPGPIVRDGHIDLGSAVRLMTSAPARLYGLRDRGTIAEGQRADLLLFDPSTIGPGRVYTRNDMPGGASRLYSDGEGVSRVIVNGVTVAREGALTGATPGTILRSGRDSRTVHANGRVSA